MPQPEFPTLSLFSGALGLDLGLMRAGFQVRVAVESNRFAAETIRHNQALIRTVQGREIALIRRSIEAVTTDELLDVAGLRAGEPVLVTAGPCCQAFSTAGQRESMGDPRGSLFRQFLRVVREAQPRFFVMENVRGVLSAAIQHRPLNRRGPGFPPLEPAEQLGSAFALILRELRSTGYHCTFDLLNAADYGVPQTRERLVFIGSRDGEPVEMPVATHSAATTVGRHPWISVRQSLRSMPARKPEFTSLSPGKLRIISKVPSGGNWRDLPTRIARRALGGAFDSWGGRSGFFRRLDWDKPAPALTTRPDSKATMLCHPAQLRPLSVQEYAHLQQFPIDWRFAGGTPQKYGQIGNAVPVGLGAAIGISIRKTMRSRAKLRGGGTILCRNSNLLDHYAARPTTVLNPPRMRRLKGQHHLSKWFGQRQRTRASILRLVDREPQDRVARRRRRPHKLSRG